MIANIVIEFFTPSSQMYKQNFIVPCVNASCSRTTGHHTIGIEESVDLLINFDSTSVGLRT